MILSLSCEAFCDGDELFVRGCGSKILKKKATVVMKVDEYLGCLVLLVFITSVVVSSLQMAILHDVLHQLNPIE